MGARPLIRRNCDRGHSRWPRTLISYEDDKESCHAETSRCRLANLRLCCGCSSSSGDFSCRGRRRRRLVWREMLLMRAVSPNRLYRASPEGVSVVVKTVPPQTRAALAYYCSRRAHLESLALVIAATCSVKLCARRRCKLHYEHLLPPGGHRSRRSRAKGPLSSRFPPASILL